MLLSPFEQYIQYHNVKLFFECHKAFFVSISCRINEGKKMPEAKTREEKSWKLTQYFGSYGRTGKKQENKRENAIFQRSLLPVRFMLEL